MAWEIPVFSWSLPANQDMSSESTYLFTPVIAVAATGSGINTPVACAPPGSTGEPIVGILQNNPQLAEAGQIFTEGVSKCKVNGTVAIGDTLMSTPSGGLITATTGNYQVGIALDAGVAGDILPVLLVNLGKK